MSQFTEEDIERAARTAHEVNRVYCEGVEGTKHATWESAPDWQKESARDGVHAIIKNPNITSEESHKSWMQHKAMNGWVYGVTKDEEKKQHPCMVPYESLPELQRVKDDLYGIVVRAVLLSKTYK